ncbi:MAG: glyceraldehyde-3-phosphate dehydrogenase [Flavobacteriia bacterium]|jgi:glyceraldehyde 3-phosphate dehydrogenase|nr:glyceraldehyde-3-phosphate dehydrogenase [Flavobacteriia bacterium]NBV67776.1 glyceraldehyde-3-phosphate dehydrogenase [Flavobacteriia bacterium]NBV91873.1 glyceraldehyde-3-phosphate dehydrogenase [Flavobacteriia bacterium]NBY41299.1 glyceraldehyde-3-phosphate dehydrogenase [Flavobacteriia bacterium]
MHNQLGYEQALKNHIEQEREAVKLQSKVGELLYEKGIELVLFRNHLIDITISEILNLHDYAAKVVNKPIDIFTTSEIASEIAKMDLAPAKLDIGKLANEWQNEAKETSKSDFLQSKLKGFQFESSRELNPRDVILYGFGRIGRLAARELIRQAGKGQQLRLRAIVTRGASEKEIIKRASLLSNDSVHGAFKGTVNADFENKCLIINGQVVHMIEASAPEQIDYTLYGIENALVIDNTGVFTDKTALSRHLQSKGVSRVILTAPGKEIPNIVFGINQGTLDLENEKIYSAASCTTNAISPILKVVNDKFGVVKGHIETVHAYTNDQNLLDNMHKKVRRGRSAAINMVITSTGAGNAVTKVIPSLQDKLTANAVRVPTPNGSLAILSLEIEKETTLESINETIKNAALNGDLVNQIYYSFDPEMVSSDIIGNTCCSVFDSNATIVSKNGKNIVLYTWYDNEFGYTKQVIRLAKYVSKVRRAIYY